MHEAKYDVKNYGDQGGCYPSKPISLVNWPGQITPHPKGFLVAMHFSGINAVLLTSFSTIINTTVFQILSTLAGYEDYFFSNRISGNNKWRNVLNE